MYKRQEKERYRCLAIYYRCLEMGQKPEVQETMEALEALSWMVSAQMCIRDSYYYVSAGTEILKQEARARGAQIVLFGHTHRPVIDYTDDVIAVNPGSISYPRQEGHRPSFVMMELDRFGDAHFTINYL